GFFNLNKCPTAHVIAKPFGKYLLSLISIYPFLFLAFFDKAALYFFAWLGFSANKIVSINYLSFRLFLMVINFSKILIIRSEERRVEKEIKLQKEIEDGKHKEVQKKKKRI